MRLPHLAALTLPVALAVPNVFHLYRVEEVKVPDTSACLRSCFVHQPACPDNMAARKINTDNCWTCCLNTDKDHARSSQEAEAEAQTHLLEDNGQDALLEGSRYCNTRGEPCCTDKPTCAQCCRSYTCKVNPQTGYKECMYSQTA